MDLVLMLVAITFILMILVKPIFSRFNIPLSFIAMFLGMILGLSPRWRGVAETDVFLWLANLGMYFMIFVIIFQTDMAKKETKKIGKYLVGSALFILIVEVIILFSMIHFLFGVPILGAILLSMIFTTVAEFMLMPILQKFKLMSTQLGKSILGIGIVDNMIEYSVLLVAMFVGIPADSGFKEIIISVVGTLVLFFFIGSLNKVRYISQILKSAKISSLFMLSIGVLFAFSSIMAVGDLAIIGALIAAIVAKKLIPKEKYTKVTESLVTTSDGLFAPIFFLWIGITTNLGQLLNKPLLAIVFVVAALLAKMIPTIIATKKRLGIKGSVILGFALKFGAGIIFIKILFEQGLINELIYTVTVSAILIYRIINPLILSSLITKWRKDIK